MSRRKALRPFSYQNLEDRRLLAADCLDARVSVLEATRTLHIRPVEHVNAAEFQSEIEVSFDRISNEIPVSYTHLTLPTTPYV